jgi:hypothetical protein
MPTEKSIKEISNEIADLLGKPRIKFPKPIRGGIDTRALERIRNQLRKEKQDEVR